MDNRKLKVGSVSYLNSKPLIYGFEKGDLESTIELLIDFPAAIAEQLINHQIDIGLVPVATIPFLKEYQVISDYCIGCNGAVATVCLFSDVPVEEIETILLDYQSKSSVALLKILLRDFWKLSPVLIEAGKGYESGIQGTTAGLVIGDRAFTQRLKSKYIYDLGEAWKALTGLPFVFAAWISNKKLDQQFINQFNDATGRGLKHFDEIVSQYQLPGYDLKKYYTQNINFDLDDLKRTALNRFLGMIA